MKINSFNPVAGAYAKRVVPHRYSQYYSLVHELSLDGDERVLDIGTGPGELSLKVAEQLDDKGHLVGIDLAPNMIKLARKAAKDQGKNNVEFQVGDALKLEFGKESFDVVLSSNAFPWVADRPKFLGEVFRVLKPGGKFGLIALSDKYLREFSDAYRKVSDKHPDLLTKGKALEVMGAELHTNEDIIRKVEQAGFKIGRSYVISTEEPITAERYLKRLDAISHENYLDHLDSAKKKDKARRLIFEALANRNGQLKITESVNLVLAYKPVTAATRLFQRRRKAG